MTLEEQKDMTMKFKKNAYKYKRATIYKQVQFVYPLNFNLCKSVFLGIKKK